MSGLILLCGILALVYVLYWMIRNDGAARIEEQTGLMRMVVPKSPKDAEPEAPEPARQAGPSTMKASQKTRLAVAAAAPASTVFGALMSRKRTEPPSPPPQKIAAAAPPAAKAEEEVVHPLWRDRPRPSPRR